MSIDEGRWQCVPLTEPERSEVVAKWGEEYASGCDVFFEDRGDFIFIAPKDCTGEADPYKMVTVSVEQLMIIAARLQEARKGKESMR